MWGTIDCSEKKTAFTTWTSRGFASTFGNTSVYAMERYVAGTPSRRPAVRPRSDVIGLRVAPDTVRLTAKQVLALLS
jgi:hypothetical protein